MEVLCFLRRGRSAARSRAELVRLTGMSDRAVRRQIEQYRQRGVWVISSSDGRGYWLTEDPAELACFLREVDARLMAQRYPMLRKALAKARGDSVVMVRQHERHIKKRQVEGQIRL